MSTNEQKNNEEEIDLGSLFIIIGKGFSNFFNFIGNIFKGIFHGFILSLLFLKKNIIKIAIGGVVGLVIGLFLQSKKGTTYRSELLVEPNFKSTGQLYNNIQYYNNLIKQKDTATIQKVFNLDKETAGALNEFTIEPIKTENDVIESYYDLVKEVDTLMMKKSYDYEDYVASFSYYDYKTHKITLIAQKNDVFSKIGDEIISSVEKNKHFIRTQKLLNNNLDRADSLFRANLSQIDSLRKVYMMVMVEEAKNPSKGSTNIDVGGRTEKTAKELELFETNREISEDLYMIAKEKAENYEVINVISNFQAKGEEIKGVTQNYAVLLALFGMVSMILFLLLLQLNKYLSTYEKVEN